MIFTDRPSNPGEPRKERNAVDLHQPNTIPSIEYKKPAVDKDDNAPTEYSLLELEQPSLDDDDYEWDWHLELTVEPEELFQGDRFVVYLDNEKTDVTSTEPRILAPELSAEPHVIQVKILNEEGEVQISSNPILIDARNMTAPSKWHRPTSNDTAPGRPLAPLLRK